MCAFIKYFHLFVELLVELSPFIWGLVADSNFFQPFFYLPTVFEYFVQYEQGYNQAHFCIIRHVYSIRNQNDDSKKERRQHEKDYFVKSITVIVFAWDKYIHFFIFYKLIYNKLIDGLINGINEFYNHFFKLNIM